LQSFYSLASVVRPSREAENHEDSPYVILPPPRLALTHQNDTGKAQQHSH